MYSMCFSGLVQRLADGSDVRVAIAILSKSTNCTYAGPCDYSCEEVEALLPIFGSLVARCLRFESSLYFWFHPINFCDLAPSIHLYLSLFECKPFHSACRISSYRGWHLDCCCIHAPCCFMCPIHACFDTHNSKPTVHPTCHRSDLHCL